MSFPLNIYLAALVSAALSAWLSFPLWRRWCLRTGLVDEPGERKIHAQPIPLAGGLAVLTGVLLPLAAAAVLAALDGRHVPNPSALIHGLERRAVELGAIALGGVGIVALGWLDDKIELKPLVKFAGQLCIAALVARSGTRVTLFVHSLAFSYAVTMLWLLTVINAFNFMDNMNGLCTGLGAIAAFCFAAIAATDGQYLVALIALLGCGALLGFLPYNFPKARAFLGDSGSHLVGYLLAVLAILPHFYSRSRPHPWAVLKPLLVLAIPLLDLAVVVLLRWRSGRPFYVGDTNHLSHRLVRRGLTQSSAVLLIWLAAAVLGAVAVL